MSTALTPSGVAVQLVTPPDLEAAQARHTEARAALTAAEARAASLKSARAELDRTLAEVKRDRAELLEQAAASEVSRLCGGEAGDTAKYVKRISESAARLEVHLLALTIADEQSADASAALFAAQSELKDSAANLIDAERYQRFEGHRAAMDRLADSEGQVEIRSQRFEEEGRIADQYRADAKALRERAAQMQTVYQTFRSARGK